jgi:hypothetical protein
MVSNNILKSARDNGLEQHNSYTLLIVPYQQTGLKCENMFQLVYFCILEKWFIGFGLYGLITGLLKVYFVDVIKSMP